MSDYIRQLINRFERQDKRLARLENHGHGQYEIGLQGVQVVTVNNAVQGLAVKCTAHVSLTAGEVVCYLQGASGAYLKVDKVPALGNELLMPMGVVWQDAAADAAVWVIVAGYAMVMPISSIAPTRGYIIYTSGTTAGRVEQAASVSSLSAFRRIGYWAADGTSGKICLAFLRL